MLIRYSFIWLSRKDQLLWLGSSETVSFLRPFLRLAASTLRPLAVDILSLNPCLFLRFLCEG